MAEREGSMEVMVGKEKKEKCLRIKQTNRPKKKY